MCAWIRLFAGDSIIGTIIFILVLLIILDLLGATDIFPGDQTHREQIDPFAASMPSSFTAQASRSLCRS